MTVEHSKIKNMVSMQFELSFTLAGTDWLTNPAVDTTSAMLKETDELIESAGYVPWWVKKEPKYDPENCKTEVVDLFHFLMQGAMREVYAWLLTEHKDSVPENEAQTLVVDLVSDYLNAAFVTFNRDGQRHLGRTDVALAEFWLGEVLVDGPKFSFDSFWEMASRFGLSLDDLYNRYMAKNMLNRFRRIANYKGDKHLPPYVKLWDGVNEDNWHVLRYLEHSQGNTEGLIEMLARIYQHYTSIAVMELPDLDASTYAYISTLSATPTGQMA